MLLQLYFVGGREIQLDVDPDEWAVAFDSALGKNKALEVQDPSDGGTLGINPRLVLYWKVGVDPKTKNPGSL